MCLTFLFAGAFGSTASATLIDIQFGCSVASSSLCNSDGDTSTTTMSGAAVIGSSGDIWNNVNENGYAGGNVAITDVNGKAAGYVSWTARVTSRLTAARFPALPPWRP